MALWSIVVHVRRSEFRGFVCVHYTYSVCFIYSFLMHTVFHFIYIQSTYVIMSNLHPNVRSNMIQTEYPNDLCTKICLKKVTCYWVGMKVSMRNKTCHTLSYELKLIHHLLYITITKGDLNYERRFFNRRRKEKESTGCSSGQWQNPIQKCN